MKRDKLLFFIKKDMFLILERLSFWQNSFLEYFSQSRHKDLFPELFVSSLKKFSYQDLLELKEEEIELILSFYEAFHFFKWDLLITSEMKEGLRDVWDQHLAHLKKIYANLEFLEELNPLSESSIHLK